MAVGIAYCIAYCIAAVIHGVEEQLLLFPVIPWWDNSSRSAPVWGVPVGLTLLPQTCNVVLQLSDLGSQCVHTSTCTLSFATREQMRRGPFEYHLKQPVGNSRGNSRGN